MVHGNGADIYINPLDTIRWLDIYLDWKYSKRSFIYYYRGASIQSLRLVLPRTASIHF
jgi:hypothetical protein